MAVTCEDYLCFSLFFLFSVFFNKHISVYHFKTTNKEHYPLLLQFHGSPISQQSAVIQISESHQGTPKVLFTAHARDLNDCFCSDAPTSLESGHSPTFFSLSGIFSNIWQSKLHTVIISDVHDSNCSVSHNSISVLVSLVVGLTQVRVT